MISFNCADSIGNDFRLRFLTAALIAGLKLAATGLLPDINEMCTWTSEALKG